MSDQDLVSAEARGARRHTFRTITLIFDNEESTYRALTGAAWEALRSYEGLTVDAYRGAYDESDRALRWEIGDAVGDALADVVREWLDGVPGVMGMLLSDLLDFGDSTLWAEIAWNYLPELGEVNADDFAGYEGDEGDG